ncbi:ATP-binding protein [Methylorubrum salsuginis]|uniref:Histidine kinase-, DNA gyrase B-, and HSP90-like ATPase n=1 Tax=Methylorubrum salsuginis TaxID=414703 RepID=A0A1I3YXG0_9HYPH|nr:ATP-binding protein [Methylorubrum salsuginis]SFK35901.1 Histidine kinase-, DNA gyrase B-, and HSP90-like ATPase [Methylorubrum salsuginis]
MRHKSIDLASEVKRAVLPDGLQGFLFPLYEAVSNSIHSLEERWGESVEEQGRIEIEFDSDASSVLIADNGVGFDEKNLGAFLTPLTGNKYERGGKGFGRFIAFKVFKEVLYSCRQISSDGVSSAGSYKYEPFADDDNLIEISSDEGVGAHRFDAGLTAVMREPHVEAKCLFDFGSEVYLEKDAREIISASLVDHFLVEFVQKKVPKNFFVIIQGMRINVHEYFFRSLFVAGSKTEFIEVGGICREFKFDYFQVGDLKMKKHRLYFYSNNRAASDLENISSGLNDKSFSKLRDDGMWRYFYLVAVSSEFFVASQSRDRIVNLHTKIEGDNKKKSIRDQLVGLAKGHILELESTYTLERKAKMTAEVEHLVAIDPLLRRGLGNKSAAEFVEGRSITETREQLAQDLFVERFRQKFDFTKISQNASVEQLVQIVKTQIPEDAKEALAVYVAYRNHVIRIFRELLNKNEDGLATEDKVHQLIYPRYKDSEEIDYSSHNLWLLDDDLAYAQYISSDRTLEGKRRGKGQFAHDILINNERELMIVEMKRPQKAGYSVADESSTDDPVGQLKSQISEIRRKGVIKTSGARDITIAPDTMVRGYVLADWNDSLQSYLELEDFIITNYGGRMAYRYYKTLNYMIEVIAFDRLIDRADNRNEAFVQILEGNSKFDLKPKSVFETPK